MTANKRSTAADWTDPDDAPDLSAPEYQAKLAATKVKRGRPKAASPKVRIGFRLAADVVESIKATGGGYNARVEQALRKAFVALKTFVARAPTAGAVAKASAPPRSARKSAAVKRPRPKRGAGKRKA